MFKAVGDASIKAAIGAFKKVYKPSQSRGKSVSKRVIKP
jgi:hypothetical protein